jgi:excisionase family DNA binding protein
MATEPYQEHIRACAKVGELLGLLVVSWIGGRQPVPLEPITVSAMDEPPMTRKQAAKYLGISESLLDRRRREGKIRAIKGDERVVRFLKSELDKHRKRE